MPKTEPKIGSREYDLTGKQPATEEARGKTATGVQARCASSMSAMPSSREDKEWQMEQEATMTECGHICIACDNMRVTTLSVS